MGYWKRGREGGIKDKDKKKGGRIGGEMHREKEIEKGEV